MAHSKAADEALLQRLREEVYALLPEVQCKGLCQEACTTITMSRVEMRTIRRRGVAINAAPTKAEVGEPCIALNKEGRCSVYDSRPTICRAYGGAESLPCPYGCEAIPGKLSDVDMFALLNNAMQIGGEESPIGGEALARVLELARQDPELKRRLNVALGRMVSLNGRN